MSVEALEKEVQEKDQNSKELKEEKLSLIHI
jgi:hypothetical protein